MKKLMKNLEGVGMNTNKILITGLREGHQMNRAKKSYRSMLLSFPKIFLTIFLLFCLLLFANLAIAQSADLSKEYPELQKLQDAGGSVIGVLDYNLDPGWWQYFQSCDRAKWISYGQKFEPRSDYKASCDQQKHDFESVVKPTLSKTTEIVVPANGKIVLFTELRVSKEYHKEPAVSFTLQKKDGSLGMIGSPTWSRVFYANGTKIESAPPKPLNRNAVEKGDKIIIKIEAGWYAVFHTRAIPAQGARVQVFFIPDITPGVDSGKTVVDNIDDLPPGAIGYVMAVFKVDKGGKAVNEKTGKTVQKGDAIYANDIIKATNCMVKIILKEPGDPVGRLNMMKANTKVKFLRHEPREKPSILLFFGKLFFKREQYDHKGYKIITSNCAAGVEGTVFETAYDLNLGMTTVSVFEGTVRLDCTKGETDPVMVNAGMQATMDNNCNHTLSILSPDNNTPAKAGWEVDVEPDDINEIKDTPTTCNALGDISYADEVVGFWPGKGTGSPYDNSQNTIGPRDKTHASLGQGGILTVRFTDNYLMDVDGPDLCVFEVGPAIESFKVEISKDGSNWIDLGTVKGQPSSIDIHNKVAPGDKFSYVRITDLKSHTGNPPAEGADIDAVGAIGAEETPTPTPTPEKFKKCEGDQPYLYVEDRIMGKGKTLEIPIMMCNAKDLANMDLDWSFDASVLKIIDVTKGSLNKKALFDWNEVSPGQLKIAFASSEGASAKKSSVAVMKFKVIGNTGATSTITGTVTTASKTDGTEISISVNPGEFTVGTSQIKGDCDGDGELTGRDALAALQMSVGKRAIDMCYDYNKDGRVDSADAREMLKAIVGKK